MTDRAANLTITGLVVQLWSRLVCRSARFDHMDRCGHAVAADVGQRGGYCPVDGNAQGIELRATDFK